MRFRATGTGSQAVVMAPNHHFALDSLPLEPVSRTYQYRKIMKPMLERKRRARINKCLDELKDLVTGTLQADGENVSKLEKADILELTVRHLHRLRETNGLFMRPADSLNMEKFWAGFHHCATEVSKFLTKYDRNIGGDIIKHITSFVPNIPAASVTPAAAAAAAAIGHYQRYALPPPLPPPSHQQLSPAPADYLMLEERSSSTSSSSSSTMDEGSVWRPW